MPKDNGQLDYDDLVCSPEGLFQKRRTLRCTVHESEGEEFECQFTETISVVLADDLGYGPRGQASCRQPHSQEHGHTWIRGRMREANCNCSTDAFGVAAMIEESTSTLNKNTSAMKKIIVQLAGFHTGGKVRSLATPSVGWAWRKRANAKHNT